jgi:hypothetical protein
VAEENCIAYRSFVGSMKERDHLEDVGVDWSIILNCILKSMMRELDLYDSGQKQVPGPCDNSNKILGFIKRMEISWLTDQLLVSEETCSMEYLVSSALYKDAGGRHIAYL